MSAGLPPVVAGRARRSNGRRIAIIAALVVGVSGFGWLTWGNMDDSIVYFLTPTELHAKGTKAVDAPVRLGGMVKAGSVAWDAKAIDLRFVVTDGTRDVPVRSRGAPPQMFRDGIGVVVEGRWRKDGTFDSSSLMVKHSNEYRAPTEGEKPADMYRSLMKPERKG